MVSNVQNHRGMAGSAVYPQFARSVIPRGLKQTTKFEQMGKGQN